MMFVEKFKGYGVWAICQFDELTTRVRRRVISDDLLQAVQSQVGDGTGWKIPTDPDQVTTADARELLNTAGPEFYAANCRAFPEEYLQTERLIGMILQKLLRVKESDETPTPQQFRAFIELWAGFNTLCAAANILRLGYPYESTTLLRSAALSAYQAIHYNDDEAVYEKVEKGKGISSTTAQQHASKVLPQYEIDGIDDDHVGRMWGTFSKYVHAIPALAFRRAFTSDEWKDLKLGARSPRNLSDLPWFKEGIAFIDKVATDYLGALDHIYPFLNEPNSR